MATETKTTWERLLGDTMCRFPEVQFLPDCEQLDHVSFAMHFFCVEIDKLTRKNAELEAQVREMATVKR
jgi:hypothetical protein